MSLGLRKSDSFKGLGNLSSGIGARHTHGELKEECRDFPPVLRRSPSSTAGRKFVCAPSGILQQVLTGGLRIPGSNSAAIGATMNTPSGSMTIFVPERTAVSQS